MNYHRVPIGGWKKSVYADAPFDTPNEGLVAVLLDDDGAIEWWLRNDPPQFHIATPAGRFEPDFVYAIRRNGELRYGVIEVKGRIYWSGPESDSRIKARSF